MMQNVIKRGLLGIVIGVTALVIFGVLSVGDVAEFIKRTQGLNYWLSVLPLLFVLFSVGLLNGLVKAPKLHLAIGVVLIPFGICGLWFLAMLGPLNGYSPEFGWLFIIVIVVIAAGPTIFWYWLHWLSKKKSRKVSDNSQ